MLSSIEIDSVFFSLLFPIYFRYNLYKNANFAIFVYYGENSNLQVSFRSYVDKTLHINMAWTFLHHWFQSLLLSWISYFEVFWGFVYCCFDLLPSFINQKIIISIATTIDFFFWKSHQWYLSTDIITVRNKVAKVMFLQACVCPHGGICLSACWDTGPWEQTPPQADTPPGADTPRSWHPHRADTPREHTPPPRETATAADGTHPTGMHSCFCSASAFSSNLLLKSGWWSESGTKNCNRQVPSSLLYTKIIWKKLLILQRSSHCTVPPVNW